MKRAVLILVFFILAVPGAFAWETWSDYVGTSTWSVKVSEDETGCGGKIKTHTIEIKVRHNKNLIELEGFPHGRNRGTMNGNTLSIPGSIIEDGSGNSALDPAMITFSPDCLALNGKYGWRYQDSYQHCSGTTSFQGTRTYDEFENQGCPEFQGTRNPFPNAPAPSTPTQNPIAAARALPLISKQEAAYNAILKEKPDDFWANYDLAELKKKQKDYASYVQYVNKALLNKNIADETRKVIREDIAKKLNLFEYPTGQTVPLLREAQSNLDNAQTEMVYNVPVTKDADNRNWYDRWREYLRDKADDAVRDIAVK